MSRCWPMILIAGLLAGAGPRDTQVQLHPAMLDGAWRLIGYEGGGGFLPDKSKYRVDIHGSRFQVFQNDQLEDTYQIRFPTGIHPKAIDLSRPMRDGVTVVGIYSLDGNTLRICWREDQKRPIAVRFTKDSGQKVLVLQRVNP